MSTLDLTTFGFTPTESLIYEVLLRGGPGTGYAVARAAGLARANAYGALEGLVQKGVARVEEGRPKRYRPEPPAALLALILDRQGQALDEVSRSLEQIAVPETLTQFQFVPVALTKIVPAGNVSTTLTAEASSSPALLTPMV